ncbi:hypothetical protein ADK38_14270, partial [Streptomyces varsoviensis]
MALEDARVSWRHATVRWDGRSWVIEDHGSTNGTYVQGQRVQRMEIGPGSTVHLGNATDGPRLILSGTPAAAPDAAQSAQPAQAAQPANAAPPQVAQGVQGAQGAQGFQGVRDPAPQPQQPGPGWAQRPAPHQQSVPPQQQPIPPHQQPVQPQAAGWPQAQQPSHQSHQSPQAYQQPPHQAYVPPRQPPPG